MRRRPVALLAVLALAGGLVACGSDDELSTAIPKTTPDLTVPTATSETRSVPESTTSPTDTSTTSTAAPAIVEPAPATTPPPPPAPAQGSSTTGGQALPGQSTTGGAPAGEFEDFCAQNPGADCPGG